jgi:recombinational DNA repair ATPase RecF
VTEQPLHVVELRAENFKRLHAIRVAPGGEPIVVIGGKNGSGKSSTLDCIETALGGLSAAPLEPIHRGARSARIVLDLDELVVERTFTQRGSQLVVRGKDGTEKQSPQKLLDSLCAKLTFDPLAFAREVPAKQDALLKRVLGLDFTQLDADRKQLFDARAEENRLAKQREAVLKTLPLPEAGLPAAELSIAVMLAEKEAREKVVEDNRRKRAGVTLAETALTELGAKIAELQEAIDEATRKLRKAEEDKAAAEAIRDRLKAEADALEDPDVQQVRDQLGQVEEINRKIRSAADRAAHAAKLDGHLKKADELTVAIEAIDAEKQAQLAGAKFPIDGLSFDETGPCFNGTPLEQCSQAEKLRVSVAIGAALHPRVRVMLVREGSLLDSDSMKLLADLAEQTGSQVWVERVGEGDPSAIVIEDGMVKAESTEAAE